MRVLLIDPDVETAARTVRACKEAGWPVDQVSSGVEGLQALSTIDYDLAVVDSVLPDMRGSEFCDIWRDRQGSTHILLVGSGSGIAERVHGLDSGADDFLTRPYEYEELMARMRALARRPRAVLPTQLRCGDLVIDPAARSVARSGIPIRLTAKEFSLLALMVRKTGQVVTRTEIQAKLWNGHGTPNANAIDVLVGRLRRRIHLKDLPPLLHTVRSAGYMVSTQAP